MSLNRQTVEQSVCIGLCLTGYDVGVPSAAIAYAHPACPVHGIPDPDDCGCPHCNPEVPL